MRGAMEDFQHASDRPLSNQGGRIVADKALLGKGGRRNQRLRVNLQVRNTDDFALLCGTSRNYLADTQTCIAQGWGLKAAACAVLQLLSAFVHEQYDRPVDCQFPGG